MKLIWVVSDEREQRSGRAFESYSQHTRDRRTSECRQGIAPLFSRVLSFPYLGVERLRAFNLEPQGS